MLCNINENNQSQKNTLLIQIIILVYTKHSIFDIKIHLTI